MKKINVFEIKYFLWGQTRGLFLNFAKHICVFFRVFIPTTLAVPEEIFAPLPRLCSISFDRCAFLALLIPPPEAQGSSTVTAKNEPPARFLNAASSPVYLARINTKGRLKRPFVFMRETGLVLDFCKA